MKIRDILGCSELISVGCQKISRTDPPYEYVLSASWVTLGTRAFFEALVPRVLLGKPV